MHTRDSLITATIAAATMTLTLTLFGPAPLDAALPVELQLPPAPPATLGIDGVELTIEGELDATPIARVHAVNHSIEPAHITASLDLYTQAPRRPTARLLSMPTVVWSQPCLIDLAPGEAKTIELVATPLPKNHEGYFLLSVGEMRLASPRFAPDDFEQIAFDMPAERHSISF